MSGTMNATQRTLAILWLREYSTVEDLADDERWGGRWPEIEQVRRVLELLVEVGKATVENRVFAVHEHAYVEAQACANVLSSDPATVPMGGDGGLE